MSSGKWKAVRIILVIVITGGVCAGGYIGYTLYQERNHLQSELTKSEKRGDLLQRKYAQEKAKAGALMRTKQALEGRIRAMQTQIDEAVQEKAVLQEQLQNVESRLADKTKHLKERIEQLAARIDTIKASRDEVVAKYREKVAIIKENEEKIAQLSEDLQRTGFELKQTGRRLENCRGNNERLCLITEELVEKYKNKGVVGTLMVTEPFTQLEKVEVEKLVQEYTSQIEKEKIDN